MAWVFLTKASSSPWPVPSDWNNSDNDVYVIAAGGGGAGNGSVPTSGGGGGACSHVANLTLSGTAAFSVPAGGTAGTTGAGGDGADVWFNGASFGAASVAAKGGGGGKISPNPSATAGAGGLASGGIGTNKFSGGNGGTGAAGNGGGSGGGGAAGPTADGANGGIGSVGGAAAGGGGGGADGGSAGGNASGSTGGSVGAGANSGGSGGAGKNATSGSGVTPNPGGNGTEFDASHGAGGGGGACGYNNNVGGAGGLYGGGGSGGSYSTAGGGVGGDGLIAIRYTPSAGTTTVNVSGTNVATAVAAIVSSTAETKAVPGTASATSSGAIVAAAGGVVSLSGATVSGTPGTIGVSVSARTVSITGALTGGTAGTITTNGMPPPVPRNGLLTRRDWTQEPGVSFSGGNWWTGFEPLSSIDPDYPICATSRLPADTTFDCDLGATRSVSVIHLQRLRVSWASRLRVRVGTSASFASTTYDSGVVAGWPQVQDQFATRPFGDWSFSGLADPEEADALGFPRWFIPPEAVSVRYARVEIWDRVAAFPPQIGCFGLCEAWELPMAPTANWSIESIGDASIQTAEYGSRFTSPYSTRRRINLGFDITTHADFVERVMSILPRAGISVPAAVVVQPETVADAWPERIGVYGLLAQADVSATHYGMYSFPLTLDQL